MVSSDEFKRFYNSFSKNIKNKIKPNECILCGNNIASCCNSHSIPQMILKNITKDGYVLWSSICITPNILDSEKGCKNSGTFKFICRNCDQSYFKDYENPTAWNTMPNNTMLAQIALKNVLQQLYKREYQKKFTNELPNLLQLDKNKTDAYNSIYANRANIVCDLDLNEYYKNIYLYKEIIDNKNQKNCFNILFYQVLPYKVPIATQAMITLSRDRNGNVINDINDLSERTIMRNIHLCVFPFSDKTVVLAFYHKKDKKLKKIKTQFNKCSPKQNLQYINWLIFKYTENFFCSINLKTQLQNINIKQLFNEDSNDMPNLGFTNSINMINYKPVKINEIPNFLSEEFKLS